jgi:hypothetical protein
MMVTGLFELLILLVLAAGVIAAVVAIVKRRGRRVVGPSGAGPVCPNPDCGAPNDPGAKFCRRCGRELPIG